MKRLFLIWASLILIASCSKAPVIPDKSIPGNGSDATVHQGEEDHEGHDHNEEGKTSTPAPDGTAAATSSHAADLDLLNAWNKGQYLGNEQLQLSYLANVPLQ